VRRDIRSRPTRLVYKPEVLRRVGCSYPTLWRWMRAGTFPRGHVVGQRTAWLEQEVDDWFDNLRRRPLKGDEE
jgi:predicted DNA-binding transcriptional regulator AlpA